MPHRILYVSRTWAMGGAQSILLSLIKSLPKDAFEIHVVPFKSDFPADDTFAEASEKAGAQLTDPVEWKGWSSMGGMRDQLKAIVSERKIDLIHSHDNSSNTVLAWARRHFPGPTLATAFGWWDLNLKLKALYAFERRFALPRFDGVYTVSHDMARKIRLGGTPDRKISVIHTGLDLGQWSPRGTRETVRESFCIAPDAVVIGAVGRVSHEKGFDHLMRAMKALEPELPNLTALLVGKGPDMERLTSLAAELGLSERVIMPGFYEDGAAALEAMDIAALPSVLDEGFPTASVEAQAVGLPIIASDIGGTRETLVAGETGILVRPGNVEDLIHSIRQLAIDPDRRTSMGQAARARIEAGFTLDRMLVDIADFYRAHL